MPFREAVFLLLPRHQISHLVHLPCPFLRSLYLVHPVFALIRLAVKHLFPSDTYIAGPAEELISGSRYQVSAVVAPLGSFPEVYLVARV